MKKILGAPNIKHMAAGWEAQTLRLCHAAAAAFLESLFPQKKENLLKFSLGTFIAENTYINFFS